MALEKKFTLVLKPLEVAGKHWNTFTDKASEVK